MDQELASRLVRRYREQAREQAQALNDVVATAMSVFGRARQAGRRMRPQEFNESARRAVADAQTLAGIIHVSQRPMSDLGIGRLVFRHMVPSSATPWGPETDTEDRETNVVMCAVMRAKKAEVRVSAWHAPICIDHQVLKRLAEHANLTAAAIRQALDAALLPLCVLATGWPDDAPGDVCLPGPAGGGFLVRGMQRLTPEPALTILATARDTKTEEADPRLAEDIVLVATFVPAAELTPGHRAHLDAVRVWMKKHGHFLDAEPEAAVGFPGAEPSKGLAAAMADLRATMRRAIPVSDLPTVLRDAPRPVAPPPIAGLPLWSALVAQGGRFSVDAASLARALGMATRYRLAPAAARFLEGVGTGSLRALLAEIARGDVGPPSDFAWVETSYADRGISGEPERGVGVDRIGFLVERLEPDYFRVLSSFTTPDGTCATTFVDLHIDLSRERARLKERALIWHEREDIAKAAYLAELAPDEREPAIAFETALGFQVSQAHQEMLAWVAEKEGVATVEEFIDEAVGDWGAEVRFVLALLARFRRLRHEAAADGSHEVLYAQPAAVPPP